MRLKLKPVFKITFYLFIVVIMAGCGQPGGKRQTPLKSDGADTAAHKLSVKNMRADLFILWSAIKEMHPAYGVYTPADSLQKVYDGVVNAIDQPMAETDFIGIVYPLLSKLRCGHTQLKHSAGYINVKGGHLPFEVLVQDSRAWVTTSKTESLHTGDEIISMNNTPVAAIIGHGADLYAGDGYNNTFKELFLSEYDGFEDACMKYYHWTTPYQVTLRTPKGALKNIQLDTASNGAFPIAPEKTADTYANWIVAKNTDYLPLRFLKNSSTAWFETHTFEYTDTLIFKDVFKQVREKGIKTLILDMRHNSGGDIRIAAKLLSYLASSPFRIVKDVRSRIPNPAINHFEKYFDASRTASFNQSFSPGNKEGAYYHVNFKPAFGNMLGTMAIDKKDHFGGKLFVLIDGATFSSAALFTAAVKEQCKGVKFIGRETAGAEEGCSGGTIQHLTLPHTGVTADFPWMRFVSVAKHPVYGHGIIPDFTVAYSPEDVVNKTDPDLKKALSLIKQ